MIGRWGTAYETKPRTCKVEIGKLEIKCECDSWFVVHVIELVVLNLQRNRGGFCNQTGLLGNDEISCFGVEILALRSAMPLGSS
jgi:hypothetical protein